MTASISRTVVFHSPDRARCNELWAVLDAAGVPAAIVQRGAGFALVVRDEDLEAAVHELDDYRREVVQERRERAAEKAEAPQPRSGGWQGAAVYVAVLLSVGGLAAKRQFGADWFDAGRAQAGLITGGEWWRTVTALTLHLDARHLIGNAVFGSVLGILAAQGLGGGAAWLVILASGVLGNAANAWFQHAEHTAVGASTAVFGALGLAVALALQQRRHRQGGLVKRWSPLAAGLVLLAWTGIGGERTDVFAHVWGLISGVLLGAAAGRIPPAVLDRREVQAVAAAVCLGILVLSWMAALH